MCTLSQARWNLRIRRIMVPDQYEKKVCDTTTSMEIKLVILVYACHPSNG
jgi:hypothetical protein